MHGQGLGVDRWRRRRSDGPPAGLRQAGLLLFPLGRGVCCCLSGACLFSLLAIEFVLLDTSGSLFCCRSTLQSALLSRLPCCV